MDVKSTQKSLSAGRIACRSMRAVAAELSLRYNKSKEKATRYFRELNYLIEGTVALIQRVDNRTMQRRIFSTKQMDDVIIIVKNILREINYQKPHHLSDPHRL